MTNTTPTNILDLFTLIDKDVARDSRSLWLTANEGLMSRTAGRYLNADFANRYFTGAGDHEAVVTNPYTPFMSRGRPGVGRLVTTAAEAAAKMLDAAAVNLNCLSGIHAMTSVILALTEPGSAVMSIDVPDGGHFATRHIVERSGRRWVAAPVDAQTGQIDTSVLEAACRKSDTTMIYLDSSYELQPFDVAAIRKAIGERVTLVYDISHTMGLMMGGVLASPLTQGADVVCGNTHKTLPGPHRALIAYRDADTAQAANDIIDSYLYSSNHFITLVALCITVLEMSYWGKAYARRVVDNAQHLADALTQRGWEVRKTASGEFTCTHQIHVLSEQLGEHRALYGRFSTSNIALGFDNCLGGRTFMRFGTQEITRRGLRASDMPEIADILVQAASGVNVAARVADIARRHQIVHYSFDCQLERRCTECA